MRKTADRQLALQFQPVDSVHSRKWQMMSDILDANPRIAELVWRDLTISKNGRPLKNTGANGITADQVLRFAIVMMCEGLSYRKLQERIEDSIVLRAFCRAEFMKVPAFTVLNENIKKLRPSAIKEINDVVMRYAKERKIEEGRQIRIDTTAIEANIHYPLDSRQLWDSIRVITRILMDLKGRRPEHGFNFHNHNNSAKTLMYKLNNVRGAKKKKTLYRKLVKIARQTTGYGNAAAEKLRSIGLEADVVCALDEVCCLAHAVIDQTERRVFQGDSVPAGEKVLSIFEPHVDIIVKGQRETVYGHKACFTGGKSNLILDCHIMRGNPADTEEFIPALERHKQLYGKAPLKVATDGGFASKTNGQDAKTMGLRDIAFSSLKGNKLAALIKSERIYKQLRKWRAGIEGVISTAKRAYGLSRCNWRGMDSFKAYVHLGVLAFNLVTLARLLLN